MPVMQTLASKIIDQVADWELEDLVELQNSLSNLIEAKEENLPDDDEGF